MEEKGERYKEEYINNVVELQKPSCRQRDEVMPGEDGNVEDINSYANRYKWTADKSNCNELYGMLKLGNLCHIVKVGVAVTTPREGKHFTKILAKGSLVHVK